MANSGGSSALFLKLKADNPDIIHETRTAKGMASRFYRLKKRQASFPLPVLPLTLVAWWRLWESSGIVARVSEQETKTKKQ